MTERYFPREGAGGGRERLRLLEPLRRLSAEIRRDAPGYWAARHDMSPGCDYLRECVERMEGWTARLRSVLDAMAAAGGDGGGAPKRRKEQEEKKTA